MSNEVKSSGAYWKMVKDATCSRVRKPMDRTTEKVLIDKENAGLVNSSSFFANIVKNIAAKLPMPSGNTTTTGAFRSDYVKLRSLHREYAGRSAISSQMNLSIRTRT